MAFEVGKIFEDLSRLSKVHSKKDYEAAMDNFKAERFSLLQDLVEATDYSKASLSFCEDVKEAYKKFGKVRGGDLMNLNYFMIYYIFPAILMNKENGQEICDTLRDTWNDFFKASISYTDYETLMGGFQTRFFGIPIGKN